MAQAGSGDVNEQRTGVGEGRGKTVARVLAVGNIAPQAVVAQGGEGLILAAFADVSAQTLAIWQPDVVISPLVDRDFDCTDLARQLVDAGFKGRYRVAAHALPDPALIRREIASNFPGLDFDILPL